LWLVQTDAGDEAYLRADQIGERTVVLEFESKPVSKEKEPNSRGDEGDSRNKAETHEHPQNDQKEAQEIEADV